MDAQAYNTLRLEALAHPILKGAQALHLRASLKSAGTRASRGSRAAPRSGASAGVALDAVGEQRFAALRAWRADVARANQLPAYVIFHDATLAAIAQQAPATLAALAGISGVGAAKLERYGDDVLRLCQPE